MVLAKFAAFWSLFYKYLNKFDAPVHLMNQKPIIRLGQKWQEVFQKDMNAI